MMLESRARRLLTVAALSLFAVTACSSSEEPQAGRPDDYVCAIPAGSAEDKLLRQVIRADSYETQNGNRTPRFVEKMQTNLRGLPAGQVTRSVRQCSYFPDGRRGDGQATIEYSWAQPADAKKGAAKGARSYELNGATGTSDDVTTDLYVQCRLPGELADSSATVLLHADASFTVNLGAVKDHGTQDQQMDFVYRMARKATEALGCENEPLAKDPVAKPLAAG
ncbi:hypothetical protein [Streptomyces sp. NPDC051921]|uniref:hypothetical protein n=1 Tax=Streptomyces sp. NPDC051921 TaxID=3155806 RepID=UPI00342A6A77